jgi:transcription initiation factor TFIID TATA-box-binding protein
MIETTIVNVVATASLCQKIELSKLKESEEISYNPSVHGGNVAYFKTSKMRGRVSVFASGKLISVGTKSQQDAFRELNMATEFLVSHDYARPFVIYPKIRNIVVTAFLSANLNLEKLAETPKAVYEPEQFPAVILHLEQPHKASILVFSSGRIVITGLTSSKQIEPIMRQARKIMEN